MKMSRYYPGTGGYLPATPWSTWPLPPRWGRLTGTVQVLTVPMREAYRVALQVLEVLYRHWLMREALRWTCRYKMYCTKGAVYVGPAGTVHYRLALQVSQVLYYRYCIYTDRWGLEALRWTWRYIRYSTTGTVLQVLYRVALGDLASWMGLEGLAGRILPSQG